MLHHQGQTKTTSKHGLPRTFHSGPTSLQSCAKCVPNVLLKHPRPMQKPCSASTGRRRTTYQPEWELWGPQQQNRRLPAERAVAGGAHHQGHGQRGPVRTQRTPGRWRELRSRAGSHEVPQGQGPAEPHPQGTTAWWPGRARQGWLFTKSCWVTRLNSTGNAPVSADPCCLGSGEAARAPGLATHPTHTAPSPTLPLGQWSCYAGQCDPGSPRGRGEFNLAVGPPLGRQTVTAGTVPVWVGVPTLHAPA